MPVRSSSKVEGGPHGESPVSASAITVGDRVDRAIRAFLAAGEIAPGETISLRQLAEVLNVSVTPVRHAMARLQADGVVEVVPGRAIRVPVLTRAQFLELTAIRMEIEGFASERAAAAREPADLDQLERINASFQLSGVGRLGGLPHASRLNKEFHFAIYHAARMPALIEIVERLWLRVGPIMFTYLPQSDGPVPHTRDGARLHRAALDALHKGDGAAARTAIATDIHLAAQRLVDSGYFDRQATAPRKVPRKRRAPSVAALHSEADTA